MQFMLVLKIVDKIRSGMLSFAVAKLFHDLPYWATRSLKGINKSTKSLT